MARPSLATATLCLCVVLAGCSSLLPTAPPSATSEETATPAPVPSDTPTTTGLPPSPTERDFPPGIRAEGVTSAFELSESHGAALSASYTVTETREIRLRNGTLYASDDTTVLVADRGARYRYTSTVRGLAPGCEAGCGNGTLTVYSNGSVVARQVHYAFSNETVRRPYTASDGTPVGPYEVSHGTPQNTQRIRWLFDHAEDVTVRSVSPRTYRLTASGFAAESVRVDDMPIGEPSGVVFTATVTADGFVESYTLSLRGTVDGDPVTASERVRYADRGETAVPSPDWFRDAVATHRNRTDGG